MYNIFVLVLFIFRNVLFCSPIKIEDEGKGTGIKKSLYRRLFSYLSEVGSWDIQTPETPINELST